MNFPRVVLLFLCVCVCDISSTVDIVANQTIKNPEDCDTSKCANASCTRAFFSGVDSRCIFLKCDNDTSCDHFITELGSKTENEGLSKQNGVDPLQPTSPSPKSPLSPSPTAPPASLSASAAPLSSLGTLLAHEEKQHSTSSSSSVSGFSSNTSDSFQKTLQNGDPGQDLNKTLQNGDPGQDLNKTLHDGYQGQALNNSLENGHQGQSSVKPSTTAPTSPPVPVASVEAGKISSTITKDHSETQVIKTGQETITTTTSVKPALPSNSTTVTNTTFTTTTVTPKTTRTTSPATVTTNKVTSPPSTTKIQPRSKPTPPPSAAPTFLPSVTPSTPPPGQNPLTTTPKVLDVTSDQDKAIVPGAGELVSHMVNTSSLIAVLIFGLLFFIITVILFLRHAYESYKRRGYTQMDYLINGMYSDSGL